MCDQLCISKVVYFSGKEEDFADYKDQFEAKMFHTKPLRVLKWQCDETESEKNFKPNASENARLRNKQHAREKFDDLKMCIWCEIVPSLDKRSATFLRPYKKDDRKAWAVLCDRHKSFERPRLQQLIEELTNLKMIANESVIDYIARAEELQSNLREFDEQVSEPMLITIILNGLTDDFDNFVTICKFSKDEQILDSIKRDLVKFENEKGQRSNDERWEPTFFGSNDRNQNEIKFLWENRS